LKIEFVRSGGVAGIRLKASLDTETLKTAQASRIGRLVDDAEFFSLPKQAMAEVPAPDRFEYRVEVSSAARGEHAIVVAETAVSARLRPLLDYLTALALERMNSQDPGNANP